MVGEYPENGANIMNRALFDGKFVKLTEDDPAVLAKAFVIWFKDTELSRLLDSDPPRTWSFEKIKQWMEKHMVLLMKKP